jgi:transcription antitermination protein NusB
MKVKSRRKAREAALQALYQIELSGASVTDVLKRESASHELSPDQSEYAERLVRGAWANHEMLDRGIAGILQEYDFDRLAAVDRNVLRLAAFELEYVPNVPPAVTINEAIEIAKKFSTAESGRFVNGVLGRFLQQSSKKDWEPHTVPEEEEPAPEPQPVELEELSEDAPELKVSQRVGPWTTRS